MDKGETNQDLPLSLGVKNELKKLNENYNQLSSELIAIKTSVENRKREVTTLKILFYTALAVLLFGFIYTNQTLQRAQLNNLEANITALKNRASQNMLSLERKLRQEILENKSDSPHHRFNKSIQNMNHALGKLEHKTKAIDKLIKKIKKDSEELISLVRIEQKVFASEATP